MSYIDEASKELFEYMPPLTKRDDFDMFWEDTIRQANEVPLASVIEEYNFPSDYVKVYSVTLMVLIILVFMDGFLFLRF